VSLQVILAKELGLCYAALALVTDYDSWKDDQESVCFKFQVFYYIIRCEYNTENMNTNNIQK
jgi:purine nucleoside phosphorylase